MILTPRRSPPCLRLGGKPAAWQSGQSPPSLMADSGKKKARQSFPTARFHSLIRSSIEAQGFHPMGLIAWHSFPIKQQLAITGNRTNGRGSSDSPAIGSLQTNLAHPLHPGTQEAWHPARSGPGKSFQFVQYLLHFHRHQSSVYLVSDHHDRRQPAGSHATQAIQGEFAIRRGFAHFDA